MRTGVAISDPGGTLARPLEVVPSAEIAGYLKRLVRDQGIEEIVVGIPKTLGGEVGFQARRVLDRLETLREEFPAVRFVEWDERLTTRLARSSRDEGRSRSRGRDRSGRRKGGVKERVDHLAAAGMLQEYLDRRAV
ncbi:Holliday junction resolvase RuvX [soil metagenome]